MASMAVNELGPMLTATEVADMLHLHVNTVKRLGDRGELPVLSRLQARRSPVSPRRRDEVPLAEPLSFDAHSAGRPARTRIASRRNTANPG